MRVQRKYYAELWGELTRSPPVLRVAYLLYGPEEYLVRHAVDRIAELCGQVRPLDLAELAGGDTSLAEVAGEMATLPMVAERRLVVVRQAEKLLAKVQRGGKLVGDAEQLRALLRTSDPAYCLILSASPAITLPAMPGGSLLRDIACFGIYPLADRPLVQWVQRQARDRGLRMDPAVIGRLVALSGSNLLDLEHELDKLAAYAPDGEVTRSLVDELADASASSLPDLLDATAARDVPRALAALDAVLLLPRNASRALPSIANVLEEIRVVITTTREELSRQMPQWKLRDVLARSQGWTLESVHVALDELFTAELAWKSGAAQLDAALTRFLVSLRTPGTAGQSEGMLNRS